MDSFLVYGLQAAQVPPEVLDPGVSETPATEPAATETAAAPPTILLEPDPDLSAGYGATIDGILIAKGLGDDLNLREDATALLFGSPDPVLPTEVRQGYIPNCPVPASLAALAHVDRGPAFLQKMIREEAGPIVSRKERKITEYYPGKAPDPLPKIELKSARSFVVTFPRELGDATLRRKSVRVTPQIYRDDTNSGRIFYAFSERGALWVSLIEKAYAVAASGSNNTYNILIQDRTTDEVLGDLWGKAASELISQINATQLAKILGRHRKVPTLLASGQNATDPLVPWHAYAVIGFTKAKGKDPAVVKLCDPRGQSGQPLLLDIVLDEAGRNQFSHVTYGKSA